MKRFILSCLLLLSTISLFAENIADLDARFANPPDSARPWVYWFWQNGLVSREGITADLEAMKRAGLQGALWMWAGVKDMKERGPVQFFSAEWWELMRHTIQEADRLGLKLNLYNGTGWSHSGGPWVKPEYSAQRIELLKDIHIQGPGKKEILLAKDDSMIAAVAYQIKDGTRIESASMIDLTAQVQNSEKIIWDAPPGEWSIKEFVSRSTGESPGPVFEDAKGLECDKLSFKAVEENFNGFVKRILDECAPASRRVIRWVHVDSYEFGTPTWTPAFKDEFKKRQGYDLLPYLPALAGQIVDTTETTERFLWDVLRTRADLFAEGIGGHMKELCRREGITLTTEPHLIGDVFDQLQYGGSVGQPVGNFLDSRRSHWYTDDPPVGPEAHLAKGEASAAYTYGLDGVVWAEAFTGIDHAHAWKESPHTLKAWGDLWYTEGINNFCFHYFAQQPWNDRRPGVTLGPWGIHFDRHNTWFEQATGYLTYLTRCQFLLRQGLPVMDVCVLTGDKVTEQFATHPELRARGYDYHGMTAEILVRDATVKDGFITLPSGMRYRLLVTYNTNLRPETMRKLRDLVRDGAVVLGMKPDNAPGLSGYPANRDEVRSIAEELWGSDPEAGQRGFNYGHGKVFWGMPEKENIRNINIQSYGVVCYMGCSREIEVLHSIGVQPDFSYARSGKEACEAMLAYMHRHTDTGDYYFVSNQAEKFRKEECSFRITGKQPELWDTVTGEIRELPNYREALGQTVIPLEFIPGQSFFIVFRKDAQQKQETVKLPNFLESKKVQELPGPWELTFDPQWGGPKTAQLWKNLQDWSKQTNDGIRYYSGKVIYKTTFTLSEVPKNQRLYLHLGEVRDIAEVRLNGTNLGTVWTYPWQVEITQASHTGLNTLEIVIVNEWVNRLIGDTRLNQEQRFTWSTHNPYKPDSPLLPSGLLGPVTIQVQ